MVRIVLIGTGNVATHLFDAFSKSAALDVVQVYGRSTANLHHFSDKVATTTNIAQLVKADMYIIAVTDDAIAEVAGQIPFDDHMIVHTSGSVEMEVLLSKNPKKKKVGVFYPLQTFTKGIAVDFSDIPICLEANSKEGLEQLQKLAKTISKSTYTINSEQRKSLHLAAVFVCNFVNHLYHIGHDLAHQHQLPFDILKPLIKETARKIEDGIPKDVQTGPAKRNDTGTIEKHLNQLDNKTYRELYQLLTKSIQQNTKNHE